MDFNLKHWRDSSSNSEEKQETSSGPHPLKQPKLQLHSSELPLFVPAATDQQPTATKFPRMGSYFNLGQWQELELQALIFRHMISGVSVPHELLHLVQKSIITSSPPPPPPPPPSYYLSHSLQQYYPPHYQPNLMQSGYWGKGAMDPEPGRCRRTDGKKWRCSRDVVAGQKYCERHVHRGRNRSRKPVETPTSTTTITTPYGGGTSGGAGETLKAITTTTQRMTAGGGGGDIPHFTLSGPSSSVDLLHLSRRPSLDSMIEPFKVQNDTQLGGGRTLRPFFDDWPRSLHESDNNINSVTSATNLSISMPGNHPTSDFSLKLGTGHEDEPRAQIMRGESERPQLNWGTNLVAPMGGPLAEALRSSTPRSSPTSVLHRLPRGSAYDASYVST